MKPPRHWLVSAALTGLPLVLGLVALAVSPPAWAQALAVPAVEGSGPWPWWALALVLFGLTAVLGVLAVLAGIGGGVLFVPIVSGLMPFIHIDFIRGAGIMVALTGAISAGPPLIRAGLADLRLAIPVALTASLGLYTGALVGLHLSERIVELSLGVIILGTAALMLFVSPHDAITGPLPDRLARWLGISGAYREGPAGELRHWRPQAMVWGLVLFFGIGFMAGMFGLGAGWANVPVLNLVMALPLRLSVGTSYCVLAIAGPAAALVYASRGAVLPLVVVPSVLGIMLGAQVGTRLLMRLRSQVIHRIVVCVLLIAGLRAFLKGLGI